MLQLLEKHLADFGITNLQTSVVSIVSGGILVMKKLGKTSQLIHQLCYAYGVHLAVCDTLHKNRSGLILQVKITITTTIKMKKGMKKVLV